MQAFIKKCDRYRGCEVTKWRYFSISFFFLIPAYFDCLKSTRAAHLKIRMRTLKYFQDTDLYKLQVLN